VAKPTKKVHVWKCEVDGEFELFEDYPEAYCPKCGRAMTKKGEYTEE
jgi:rRNA maturation endonuclease Nob1